MYLEERCGLEGHAVCRSGRDCHARSLTLTFQLLGSQDNGFYFHLSFLVCDTYYHSSLGLTLQAQFAVGSKSCFLFCYRMFCQGFIWFLTFCYTHVHTCTYTCICTGTSARALSCPVVQFYLLPNE